MDYRKLASVTALAQAKEIVRVSYAGQFENMIRCMKKIMEHMIIVCFSVSSEYLLNFVIIEFEGKGHNDLCFC